MPQSILFKEAAFILLLPAEMNISIPVRLLSVVSDRLKALDCTELHVNLTYHRYQARHIHLFFKI